MLLVEVQECCRCPSFRGRTDNAPIAFKMKMIQPTLFARMKQRNKIVFVSGFRIGRCDVWPFLEIAMQAGKAKITVVIGTAMLLGNNVIDLVR
jgi:hypothetical protein